MENELMKGRVKVVLTVMAKGLKHSWDEPN